MYGVDHREARHHLSSNWSVCRRLRIDRNDMPSGPDVHNNVQRDRPTDRPAQQQSETSNLRKTHSPPKYPLLPNPRHELHPPLANPPMPTRTRQNRLPSSSSGSLSCQRQQNQLIHVLAISGTSLPGPFVLAEVHPGEVGCGVGCVAGGQDRDALGCEGVLRGDCVEAAVVGVWLGWFSFLRRSDFVRHL